MLIPSKMCMGCNENDDKMSSRSSWSKMEILSPWCCQILKWLPMEGKNALLVNFVFHLCSQRCSRGFRSRVIKGWQNSHFWAQHLQQEHLGLTTLQPFKISVALLITHPSPSCMRGEFGSQSRETLWGPRVTCFLAGLAAPQPAPAFLLPLGGWLRSCSSAARPREATPQGLQGKGPGSDQVETWDFPKFMAKHDSSEQWLISTEQYSMVQIYFWFHCFLYQNSEPYHITFWDTFVRLPSTTVRQELDSLIIVTCMCNKPGE